jgi:hypothetical protein
MRSGASPPAGNAGGSRGTGRLRGVPRRAQARAFAHFAAQNNRKRLLKGKIICDYFLNASF